MWWEIMGCMQHWTLICDIRKPLSASHSIREWSNLNSSLPQSLSIDKAIWKDMSSCKKCLNADTTNSMSLNLVWAVWDLQYKWDVGLGLCPLETISRREGRTWTNLSRQGKQGCVLQAPEWLLQPWVPSVGCSVSMSVESQVILLLIITYHQKRSELCSTWIFECLT